MIAEFSHIRERRAVLRRSIDVGKAFAQWEETCVPSYCHRNPAAAYVSWMRLFAAARMARDCLPRLGRVLDFGASVGELSHVLRGASHYDFIEQDPAAAAFLSAQNPAARPQTLEAAPKDAYDAVFAIDALEHNDNFAELLGELSLRVAPGGVLILSGPTENACYRLGRRIAGFHGGYHVTNIHDIEASAADHLERVRLRTVPLGLPLFRITAWRRPAGVVVQAA